MIKFLKFVPVQLTFFLILGILSGNYFNFAPIQILWIGCICLVLFIFQYLFSNKTLKLTSVFSVLALLMIFIIGIASITFKNEKNRNEHYSNNAVFALDENRTSIIKIQKELKPNKFYKRYEAEFLQLENENVIGRVLINVVKNSNRDSIHIDDELLVIAPIQELKEPLNPFGFNYKKYLNRQQIFHQINVNDNYYLILDNSRNSINGFADSIRSKINESLVDNGFKKDELAVINALLLGQRNTISKDLLESYKGAGAIHILAVSGLHIGVILLVLLFIFKPLNYFKNGKLITAIVIILLLWCYAIIAGLSASIVRAVSMFTALTIGMQLVKRSNIYNTLIISMFFLLLFNPYYLFDVGFQLSYLAVFSIVWIQPKIYNLWISNYWFFDKVWQLFTVSLAAQIGVLPLSLFYFHQFPGLFFLSNLVIIPFLGIILMFGIGVIILSLANALPVFLAILFQEIIQLMNQFVEWIANQSFFLIQNITFSFSLMMSIYCIIFLTFKWIEKKNYSRLIFVLFAILVFSSVLIYEKFELETKNELVIFNKSKSSIIGRRFGDSLVVNSGNTIDKLEYVIRPYLVGSGIGENYQKNESKRLFRHLDDTILVIDSIGIYELLSIKPTIILIQNSPKINLDRMLKRLQPRILVADGSNYKSYLKKIEQTCVKNKTPFHNTMEKGAYIIN